MRIAFIGVGNHHYPVYVKPVLAMPQHKVVAVSDPDPEVALAEADQIGCASFTDFRELVRAQKPDFVFALGRHCDMAEEATFLLDEGVPFIVEKPAGLNYAEVNVAAEKAAQKGAFAAVGLAMRDSDLAKLIQHELAEDSFEYVLFRWFGYSTARYQDPRWKWMLEQNQAGGGALINLGVHHVDWFRMLIGRRTASVSNAIVANLTEGNSVEDYSMVTLQGNGTLGVLETGYLSPGQSVPRSDGVPGWIAAPANPLDMHYVLRSDHHHITVYELRNARIVDLDTGATRNVQGTTTQNYELFTKNVLDDAQAGRLPAAANLTDMAEVMRIVDDAYRIAGPLPSRGVAAGVSR